MGNYENWYSLLHYVQIGEQHGGVTRSALERYKRSAYKDNIDDYIKAHIILEIGKGDPRDRRIVLTSRGKDLLTGKISIEDVEWKE